PTPTPCPGGTTTTTFSNSSSITIADSAAQPTRAVPYPSDITVAGLNGSVQKVTVTLNNLSHTFPDDVDILLVAPGGQVATIFSDVGGSTAANNVTLTLDDAALSSLPDTGPLTSGTFKPSNFGAPLDIFPTPAPAPTGAAALSVFNGGAPNGTWSLYVVDDLSGDAGQITGGWSISLTSCAGEPPTISCPANFSTPADANSCGAAVNFNGAHAATATGNPVPPVTYSPASGSTLPVGTTTVTATAANAFGSVSCTFDVTVTDNQNPSISAPAPVTVHTGPGATSCGVFVGDAALGTATANDNCSGVSVSRTGVPAGNVFPTGTTTITYTATDGAGNTSSASQSVTVIDDTPPTLNLPPDIAASTTEGSCSVPVNFVVTAHDNCPGVNVTTDIASGTVFPKGTTTVHATATDAHGNTTTGSFNVTVADHQAPVISCPANIVVPAGASCTAIVNYTVTATDNCPGVTVITDIPSGSTFPAGTTTVHATAADSSGNMSSCAFTVTVQDTQPPTLSAVTATPSSLWPPNHKMKTVTVNYTTSDNCGGGVGCVLSVTSNEPIDGTGDGDTSPDWLIVDAHHVQLRAERSGGGNGRIYTITVTCKDAAGNTTVRTTTVTVAHNL
ncbi:MAG: HYR domain-containing protein, partial [Pyrinomonadaceae bacterium]